MNRLYNAIFIWRTQLIAFAGLMSVAGCQSGARIQVARDPTDEEPAPVRLLIEGKEVAKLNWGDKETFAELTAQQTAVVDRTTVKYKVSDQGANAAYPVYNSLVPAEDPTLSLQMSTPDGWSNYPARFNRVDNDYHIGASIAKWAGLPGHEYEDEALIYVPNVTLYLDNRGCPKSELAYGQLTIIFPKDRMTGQTDTAAHLTVPAARLAENMGVSLNGQRIGSIDIGPASHANYLFDCSGKRSYRWREVVYCTEFGPCGMAKSIPNQLMSGEYLYRLPGGVLHFIEPAPYLRGYSTKSIEVDTELVEVKPK